MMQLSIEAQYLAMACDTLAPMRTCITPLPGAVTVPLGDSIRELREARDISQRELARRSGVKQPIISRIEAGDTLNPRYETLRAIAEALNVPLTAILGRSTPVVGSSVSPSRVT